jgi:ABC-type nitrate/sulfonate/bicarbonate transport system substrate-binding protein
MWCVGNPEDAADTVSIWMRTRWTSASLRYPRAWNESHFISAATKEWEHHNYFGGKSTVDQKYTGWKHSLSIRIRPASKLWGHTVRMKRQFKSGAPKCKIKIEGSRMPAPQTNR